MFVQYQLDRMDEVTIGPDKYRVSAVRELVAPAGTTSFEFDDPSKPDDDWNCSPDNPLNACHCDDLYWRVVSQRYEGSHRGDSLGFESVEEAKAAYAACGWKIVKFFNVATTQDEEI